MLSVPSISPKIHCIISALIIMRSIVVYKKVIKSPDLVRHIKTVTRDAKLFRIFIRFKSQAGGLFMLARLHPALYCNWRLETINLHMNWPKIISAWVLTCYSLLRTRLFIHQTYPSEFQSFYLISMRFWIMK